jgi:DNA-directed RNA polymerase subunit beta
MSLRVSPGIRGTIIGAQVFSREGADKDERTQHIVEEEETRLRKDERTETRIIQESAKKKVAPYIVGQTTSGKLLDISGETELLKKGDVVTQENFEKIPYDSSQAYSAAVGC